MCFVVNKDYAGELKTKRMAKGVNFTFRKKAKKKRPGVHSKNASKGQTGYKKKSRGQGK